jgi:hypothetical protein
MITLYLQDAQTGVVLGSQQVSEIPAPGATLSILNCRQFIPLEVMRVSTEPVNEGSLFASRAHWAQCRFKRQ